ncbi:MULTISPECIES: hypothetical protein [unclassified Nocardioides]|uniref:hypothetical protein n=1 Tax=unclassified Nocardioides TaxID=2615069 RepID=UPI0006F89E8E|nr:MULTISPECIES: hypothetical protein [unclassified Nocardioides]KRA30910.1 hypothetical protein ASD81_15515 [Nocardioides sp. Root614]KRA87531.1 hypothetical protein ASD84_15790 [Nocardioides sp. Root682]
MSRLRAAGASAAAGVLTTGLLVSGWMSAGPAASAVDTWYVKAGATTITGTADRPFGSLAQVESASHAGDTIVVLPADGVLDGGIQLKPGQTLQGSGPSALTAGTTAARLTNTTTRLSGDAVRLADGATVANLRITDARRGAVYGVDVTDVHITGNDVSGQNADCIDGYLIPPFMAPTNLPGIGIPIANGLQNGWAGLMVDASSRQDIAVSITGNLVHDAMCGDGIDVRLSGTATGTATITDNTIHSLRQGKDFRSVLAIGLQARDAARLRGLLHRNTQALLGNPDDLNLAVEGADSEGVFLNAVGPAQLTATVTHNAYTNEHGWGGFSANGLEAVTMGSGARLDVLVQDSSFSGSPGDVIEHGGLGTDALMTMTLERVTAERSRGIGNTVLLPFNNGDCVLAGSLGARNTIRLAVRDSVLRRCANNGLSLGSNVVNGKGPTTEITATVDGSTITDNRGANIGVRNFTALEKLSVKVQRTDLSRAGGLGSGIADFSAENLGTTRAHVIDIGGGPLGSVGQNCLVGGLLAADVLRYDVSARHNWWGRPGGPGLLRTLSLGGVLDTSAALASTPCGA